jgi:ankyrin repeat protein
MDAADIDTSLFNAIEARQPLDVIRALVEERPHLVRERTVLHWATMMNLPVDTIRFLYLAWPQALREADGEGMRPFHWLVDKRNRNVVVGSGGENDALENAKFLLEEWPEALQQPNQYGQYPIHEAAANASLPPVLFQLLVGISSTAQLRQSAGWGRLPIHLAATFGLEADSVRALLDADPESIREKNEDGQTPLHLAASGDNVPLVQLLIERGSPALLLERDNQGRVPLHWTAAEAWEGGAGEAAARIGRALIEACPDSVRVRAIDGCLPLHLAARGGAIELARRLVREWPESVREADPNGLLPLHHAAASEQDVPSAQLVETAQFLINEWPDSILEQDGMGRTLLHIAVLSAWSKEDYGPMLDFFLERVPECLQVQDQQGRLPLHMAELQDVARRLVESWPAAARVQDRVGRLPVHVMLMTRAASVDPEEDEIDEAREESRLMAARSVAEAWPDSLLVPDQEARLPLHVLLGRGGSVGVALPPDPSAPLLLRALLLRGEKAALALDQVAALDVARYLVETRPRALQARDRKGRLPLHAWAAHWNSSLDAVPILVEPWPASLLVADYEGRLPVHVLLERKDASLDRARLLVEACPGSLRAQDEQGRLPLHVWVSHPHAPLDIARLLIDADSGSLQVQDKQGRVPLLVAVTIPDPSLGMVQLLVKECSSSLQILDSDGRVPLQVAAAYDAPLDIVYYLARQRPELLCHRRVGVVRSPPAQATLASPERPSKLAMTLAGRNDPHQGIRSTSS